MTGVISTNPARYRDCYRCVRTCTVKAVRVSQGQAEVVPELCIACANCVRACPQGAKVVRDDLPAIQAALAAGQQVVASVAPSAPAYFEMSSFSQMEQALASLGFCAAGETAFGAEMVGVAHGDLAEQVSARRPIITSSCPVIVNLIERYHPDLIPHLAPLVSPMIAKQLHIQDISPSAAEMSGIARAQAKGRPVREIVHIVDDFVAVRNTGTPILGKKAQLSSHLVVEQSIVLVGGENLIVAIMRNITAQEQQHQEMEHLRTETLHRTQEVINKQMRAAHEIAGLLGETTAETKVLLTQLARLMDGS